jgi:hypothetical protein
VVPGSVPATPYPFRGSFPRAATPPTPRVTTQKDDPYPLSARVFDAVRAPGRLFRFFLLRTPWADATAVAVALAVAAVLLTPQWLFVARAREVLPTAGVDPAALPPPETLATHARLLGALGAAVGTPTVIFVTAALLALLFTRIGRGRARFLAYLAVSAHAMLIPALGALATLPLRVALADPDARLSAALLAPRGSEGTAAHRVLDGLEVFTLWTLVLLALGVAELNVNVSRRNALVVVLGMYLVAIGGAALMAG